MDNLPNEKTSLFGIEINGEPQNNLIKLALGSSLKHLNIKEFMDVTNFNKNNVMTDYFWQVLIEKRCIHLSTPLIKCLGYEGELRSQQQAMKKFLKSNGVELLELNSSDERIKNYPTIEEEIKTLANKGAIAKKKWLIVKPREFKKIIMKLNTKNGDTIREYYICLEEFIKIYFEYSLYFKERESQIELQKAKLQISSLEEKLEKIQIDSKERHEELMCANEDLQVGIEDIQERLDYAVEDRAPKVDCIPQRERFVIFKKNISLKSGYYVMRGQDSYINQKLVSHKLRYPKMTISLDIECQPNPRNLFIRFRELKDERFGIRGNNILTLYEQEMIDLFKKLNEEKRNI